MPIRDIKIKNSDGSDAVDDGGDFITEIERFADHFIADTKEEADKLIKKFETDIKMLAIKRHMLTGLDKEDFRQEGLIGLARANRDFEESRSKDFRIFALYKIKDAMREFTTTQASNIKTPQYIKDAIHLIESLKKVIGKACDISYLSYHDVWELSENLRVESKEIQEDINKVKTSINNLALRSCCPVPQLLERAEIMPRLTVDADSYSTTGVSNVFEEEDNMVRYISNKESMKVLAEILDESEITLLWDRFVYGKTVRELAPEMGIKAETIVVRTNHIMSKLRKHRDRILQNETNTITKETKQRQLG